MSRTAESRAIRLPSAQKQRKTPRRYSLDEYLIRETRAKERHEYYNGIISKIPMATGSHNIVVANEVLLINPILVVEVLSKSARGYDRVEKFAEYKTLESFKEYLLVDPYQHRLESRFREEPNLWREYVVTDLEQSIPLHSVGCALQMADVYRHIKLK